MPQYEDYEQIISLLKAHPKGLTTPELKRKLAQLDERYEKLSNKTILNKIKRLSEGAIPDIEVTQGARRMPHRLIADRRSRFDTLGTTAQLIGEEQAFLRLALQSIAELPELSDRHYRAIESRFQLDTLNTPYFIESQEAERLDMRDPTTSFLQDAIKKDHPVAFEYRDESSQNSYLVEPYKLIVFDGLWYLFGKDLDEKESSPYKTWRLKYIEDVDVFRENRHATPDTVIERILAQAKDADFVVEDMSKARMRKIAVKVWVDACIADEVRLPGFQSKTTDDDRGYLIDCIVSTTDEIDKDIKKWLPHIRVIEPESYRRTFEAQIASYAASVQR